MVVPPQSNPSQPWNGKVFTTATSKKTPRSNHFLPTGGRAHTSQKREIVGEEKCCKRTCSGTLCCFGTRQVPLISPPFQYDGNHVQNLEQLNQVSSQLFRKLPSFLLLEVEGRPSAVTASGLQLVSAVVATLLIPTDGVGDVTALICVGLSPIQNNQTGVRNDRSGRYFVVTSKDFI